MSQRAATRGFFLCILCILAVFAAPPAEAQLTFSPGTVTFGVGETSEVITATITYATTPPTGQQSLTFVGDSNVTTIPPMVTFMPPASPGSVNVQFQLVAGAPATTGSGNEFQVSTLGVPPAFLFYDLGPVGITPHANPVVAGATTGTITATLSWVTTPPGGTLELVVGGLPPGATTVPAPVTFPSPTGWYTTVSFQIATTAATPVGSHTLTASTASIPGGVATFTLDVLPPPTTTITPGSASISACRNGPAVANSVTITVTGFSGQANVTFPGLPSGLSISPSVTIPAFLGPTPTTVNFDVSANVDSVLGPNTVVVEVQPLTGPAATTSFTVNVSAGDYTPLLSPTSITLFPGGEPETVTLGASTAACPPPGGFLWVIPETLPAGIVMNPPEPYLESPYDPIAVTFSASSSTSAGTYHIVFPFVTDDIPTKTRVLTVVVRSPGALSAAIEKATLDVCPGGAAGPNSITVTPLDDYEGAPTVTFLGVPQGLTITPSTIGVPELPPAQTVPFTVAASPNVPAGSYEIAARVRDDSGVGTVVTFVVNVVTDGFSASVAPATATLDAGGPGVEVTATVTSIDCGVSPASVTIAPTGLPDGVTATPLSIVVKGPPYAPAVFTLSATGSTPPGSVAATFTFTPASGTPRSVTLPVSVVRTGRIGLSVERATMDLCPGGAAGTNTVLLTPIDGYSGTPAISFPSLPAGLAIAPSELPVPAMPPAQLVAFQLTAAAGMPAGPATVTVVVSDPRGPSATATFVVNVLPPEFTPVVAPSPATVNAGGAGATLNASFVPGACAPSSDVTVTPSGLPPGVTVSPASAVLAAPAFAAAPFSFQAASSAAPGPTTVTFTFSVGGTARTATAVVEVCGPPAPPVSPAVRPQGNPAGPVTATDFLGLSWSAPATGAAPTRYEWRLNGGAWTATAGTSATAPPRGSVDPVQLFVRGYACSPEKGPGTEASSPVYPLAPPVASFSVPVSIVAGRPATFTDTSTPQATSWLWFPGDGMAATTVQSPTVTFPAAGPKVIVLVATNGSGSSSRSAAINVLIDVLPASAGRAATSSAVRLMDRQADGRLALDRVRVESGNMLLLRRLEGDGEAVAFLRLVDADGNVVVERRLVLAAGEEARHDLSAWGASGVFRVELVGPEGLEAAVEEFVIPFGGPELPVAPRTPRRVGGL